MSAHAPVWGDFEHFVDSELFGREETKKFFCSLCSKYLAKHGLNHWQKEWNFDSGVSHEKLNVVSEIRSFYC